MKAQRSKQTRSGEQVCFGGEMATHVRDPCAARRTREERLQTATAMDWATATRGTSCGNSPRLPERRFKRARGGADTDVSDSSLPEGHRALSGVPMKTPDFFLSGDR